MTMLTRSFRYDTSYRWYKGNTHVHSTASDGGKSLGELSALYASAGYDFLFCTDHWIAAYDARLHETTSLLVLDGIELDGRDHTGTYYHVVCLGQTTGITREDGFDRALQTAREQNAILVLAHPHWVGNTLEEANRWGFHGVEIYNHVCHWLNGKGDGAVYWNAMLKQNPHTLAFAVDDAPLRPEHPGWDGGWIMVNTPELSQQAILGAIKRGNYFSSCGPEFKTITLDENDIVITTSPVQFVRLVGPASLGKRLGTFDGQLLTTARLEIPTDWDYAYLEIEDANGHRAWSNTLFSGDHPASQNS
jgi:hypothetical protein